MLEVYAAVAHMAILDYQDGYTSGKYPDAAGFLTAAGLLTGAGLHYGGIEPRKKRLLAEVCDERRMKKDTRLPGRESD